MSEIDFEKEMREVFEAEKEWERNALGYDPDDIEAWRKRRDQRIIDEIVDAGYERLRKIFKFLPENKM